MPELPEVETIKLGLNRLLPGKIIKDVWHDWPRSNPGEYIRYSADSETGYVTTFFRQNTPGILPQKKSLLAQSQPRLITQNTPPAYSKSFPNAPSDVARFLLKAQVSGVRRRAKVLIIDLSSSYSLVIHLKMTGQLVFVDKNQRKLVNRKKELGNSQFPVTNSSEAERFGGGHPSKDLIGELPAKATRVVIEFTDGSKLFFNDQRKFGWMRLLPTIQIPEIDFFKKVGPEPLEDDFTAKDFIERVQRRKNSAIKAVILDQTVLAGVGNIYADESLFMAKIHPSTIVSKISRTKLVTLHSATREVMNLSIAKGGSTDRNFVDSRGRAGSYLSFAQVFRKTGQPCPRCGAMIEKIRVAGRGTHICPRCQRL